RKCLEGCAEDWMRAEYDNADIRLDDVGQLSIYSEKFESLDDFLSDMALQTNMDGETANLTNTEQEDALNLSTIHQVKGLEYDVVFVIMLCEGMFPSYRSIENPDSLEEERRLFYVALTRAKDELYLVWPKLRNAMGQFERQLPSRFIKEIQSENLLEEWNLIPPHERIPVDEDEEDEDDFSEDENYSQEEDAPF
ncbi:MAG: ATP-dependent helicase, partial [Verrucomicrobia bacterium]|nr:ATP-dependent helicase [Verrucomicrobiota bacterium]